MQSICNFIVNTYNRIRVPALLADQSMRFYREVTVALIEEKKWAC